MFSLHPIMFPSNYKTTVDTAPPFNEILISRSKYFTLNCCVAFFSFNTIKTTFFSGVMNETEDNPATTELPILTDPDGINFDACAMM